MPSVLPIINTNIKNYIYKAPTDGALIYKYAPFKNLKKEAVQDLTSLRLDTRLANVNINTVVSVEAEVSYDNSVNLVINDKTNSPKIINSRFYLTGENYYKIADRDGDLDTNIYNESTFAGETSLIKTVSSVVNLEFLGIEDGGSMPVGNYTFYFKLADADGNESDIISESGKVICHIGSVNQPSSIRGGQKDENSGKIVKFKLTNLDLGYDYVNIYYSRSTGDGDIEEEYVYRILDKYLVKANETIISITGYEAYEKIDNSEINTQYTNFDSVQSLANCQNITFAANTSKNYDVFKTLEKYSLFITPELVMDESIGKLDHTYKETVTTENSYEYYNTKNIYYRLGYWDEEIYRFGIVYILNDYTLSPVFNIRGIKELSNNTLFYDEYTLSSKLSHNEDFILNMTNDADNPENTKGVFKINYTPSASVKMFTKEDIFPIGLKFNFTKGVIEGDNVSLGLKYLTKGFFIVRQKRIPTIITQGMSIATSAKGSIPVLLGARDEEDGSAGEGYFTESFLSSEATGSPARTIFGRTVSASRPKLQRSIFPVPFDIVNRNALICPEVNLRPAVFGSLFNSSSFTLKRAKMSREPRLQDTSFPSSRRKLYSSPPEITFSNSTLANTTKATLVTVDSGVKKISIGNTVFSSSAGSADVV